MAISALLIDKTYSSSLNFGLVRERLSQIERQGITYELLLVIFSMEILLSLLYRNWSVNFFTELTHLNLPPELTWVGLLGFFPCTLLSVANHVIAWDKDHAMRNEYVLSIRSAEMGVAICVVWAVL